MVPLACASSNWIFGKFQRRQADWQRRTASGASDFFELGNRLKPPVSGHFVAVEGAEKFPKIFVAYLKSFATFAHSRLGEFHQNLSRREQFLNQNDFDLL